MSRPTMEQDNGQEEADVGTRRPEAQGAAHEERECACGSGQRDDVGAEVGEAAGRGSEGDTEGRQADGRSAGIVDAAGADPEKDTSTSREQTRSWPVAVQQAARPRTEGDPCTSTIPHCRIWTYSVAAGPAVCSA